MLTTTRVVAQVPEIRHPPFFFFVREHPFWVRARLRVTRQLGHVDTTPAVQSSLELSHRPIGHRVERHPQLSALTS